MSPGPVGALCRLWCSQWASGPASKAQGGPRGVAHVSHGGRNGSGLTPDTAPPSMLGVIHAHRGARAGGAPAAQTPARLLQQPEARAGLSVHPLPRHQPPGGVQTVGTGRAWGSHTPATTASSLMHVAHCDLSLEREGQPARHLQGGPGGKAPWGFLPTPIWASPLGPSIFGRKSRTAQGKAPSCCCPVLSPPPWWRAE